MNKRQKIVQEAFLDNEEAVIRRLKQVYNQSLKDITAKAKALQDQINTLDALEGMTSDPAELAKLKSMKQAKVYQKQYQDALKKQVNSILDNMQVEEFKTVAEYLNQCYEEAFVGTMFDLQGQGIPLCFPMDQEAMVRAVQLDSKISNGLYSRLGEDVALLKKKITAQVSRGISTGMSFQQVAKGLSDYTNIGFNNAVRIARTEGHRIQVQSGMDACYKAKDKGADVVKQWDSTLDGNTRESHQKVDGEIKELDEPFSNGLMFPGDPSGGASEVVNCRCALLQRARWALDDEFSKYDNFLGELKQFENDEAYQGFKKDYFSKENVQYMQYVKQMEKKYRTKDFNKILAQMDDDEYKHFKKLEKARPSFDGMYKGHNVVRIKATDFEGFKKEYMEAVEEIKKPVKEITIQDVNAEGSKMLSDAYEHHRIENNMTSVPLEELGDMTSDIINVDYGKMSVESANAFNETIGELASEYDTPLQRIRTMTREEFMMDGDAFAYVTHDYTVDSAELVINPTKCKDVQKLTERIKELSEDGYCVKISEEVAEKYVATHEFAHTLINLEQPLKNKTNWLNADYDKIKKVRKEINAVYEDYLKEVQELTEKRDSFLDGLFDFDNPERMEECTEQYNKFDDMLNEIKLSEYSLVNADEFMAEAFANEKIGISSNKHSKKVLEILDKHFKR